MKSEKMKAPITIAKIVADVLADATKVSNSAAHVNAPQQGYQEAPPAPCRGFGRCEHAQVDTAHHQ